MVLTRVIFAMEVGAQQVLNAPLAAATVMLAQLTTHRACRPIIVTRITRAVTTMGAAMWTTNTARPTLLDA